MPYNLRGPHSSKDREAIALPPLRRSNERKIQMMLIWTWGERVENTWILHCCSRPTHTRGKQKLKSVFPSLGQFSTRHFNKPIDGWIVRQTFYPTCYIAFIFRRNTRVKQTHHYNHISNRSIISSSFWLVFSIYLCYDKIFSEKQLDLLIAQKIFYRNVYLLVSESSLLTRNF